MSERELLDTGFRYALALTHSATDAEDLVQEAWLKLYERHGSRFDSPALFTTIRRLFIDQYRRNKLILFEPFDEERDVPDADLFPGDLEAIDLEPALAELRPEEREAIFLNSVEGYSARQIATFTQRPRSTVLSLIQRGKEKMAKMLRENWGDARENAG